MRTTLALITLSLISAQASFAQKKEQETVPLPSTAEVITNYLNAIGGTAALAKLNFEVAKGTYENSQWGSGTNLLEIFKKFPDKWLFRIRGSDGGVYEQGYNGKVGWGGMGELEDEQVALFGRFLGLRAGMELPKVLPKMKPIQKTKIGGKTAFAIEAPLIAEKMEKLYFDAKNGLLVQEDFGGGSLHYEDYREVDGVKVPFTVRQEGSPDWTIKFKEIKHNVPVEDSKFERPKNP
jgi:hypothetical protein